LNKPASKLRSSLDQALQFFRDNSHAVVQSKEALAQMANNPLLAAKRGRLVTYPGDKSHALGTLCLLISAHIDYIRALEAESSEREGRSAYLASRIEELYKDLAEYLAFLMSSAIGSSGVLANSYTFVGTVVDKRSKLALVGNEWTNQVKFSPSNSPYFDGEGLLALARSEWRKERARYVQCVYVCVCVCVCVCGILTSMVTVESYRPIGRWATGERTLEVG
jgi:hypothetical protein